MEENGLMMRCAKCGEMNRLPVVHCKRCGAKLDFEAAEKRMMNAAGRGGHRIHDFIRLMVAVALVLIILLMIWPGQMTRTTGEPIDAKRYRMKGELLIDALNRGVSGTQVIEEREINAHLAEVVAKQPAPGGGLSPVVEDVAARFFAGRAEAFIAVRRGPFTLTGHFFAEPAGSKLVVTEAKVGHLPLPGALGRFYAGTTRGMFRQMQNEARILRNRDKVAVNDGSIELVTASGE